MNFQAFQIKTACRVAKFKDFWGSVCLPLPLTQWKWRQWVLRNIRKYLPLHRRNTPQELNLHYSVNRFAVRSVISFAVLFLYYFKVMKFLDPGQHNRYEKYAMSWMISCSYPGMSKIFHFSKTSKLALGRTQSPIVYWASFLGVKGPERGVSHNSHPVPLYAFIAWRVTNLLLQSKFIFMGDAKYQWALWKRIRKSNPLQCLLFSVLLIHHRWHDSINHAGIF